MRVLVIAEHDNASLKPSTLNTISAAKKLTDDVDLIICGFECDNCLLYTSPSPRDSMTSRMPSSA